jgi:CheY-like chemotaxis protein
MTLEPRAAQKGIRLMFNIDGNVPQRLIADPVRLTQIIINLTGNAIKFTEQGHVDIRVRYLEKCGSDHVIKFEVSDTGIGIAPENIDRIFEHFSQADADTSRKFGGTGLGLSISKNLLELMGSKIHVESKLGAGSVFSFSLNLAEGDEQPVESVTGSTIANEAVEGLCILLVEDNKINQLVASQFIKKWGIEVDIADDGLEAVQKVQQKKYDLVLMDLEMPGMDGFEASREIRKLNAEYFQELPVLALSASAMKGMKEKVMLSGMNDYVAKPFSPTELRSKIFQYASKKCI